MSQYLARLARKQGWSPADLRARVSDLEAPIRWFLSGQLRIALLGLLDEAIADPACAVHAALYELSDEELVGRLALLRGARPRGAGERLGPRRGRQRGGAAGRCGRRRWTCGTGC
jgi:hypothetical protein